MIRQAAVVRVEVWWTAAHEVELAVLSEEERGQVARLRNPEARALRATSFALRRAVLARYAGGPPSELVFERRCELCGSSEHGRPRLAARSADEISFSASRAAGLAVVAVTRGQALGVDVEGERDQGHWDGILPAARNAGDDDLSPRALWTAKEATLKALGLGLAVPPHRLRVVEGIAGVGAGPERRAFHVRWARPTPRHLLAVAHPQPAAVRLRRVRARRLR